MSATWDEIRRLAADLQRAQLEESSQRLSERNCVEVVSKLIESKLVDLVFSIDGKDYITNEYLETQIKNECLGNKGRVSLVELQQSVNVEFDRIKWTVEKIVKEDHDFVLSVGELIAKDYLEWVCSEVDSRLADEGRMNMSQITRLFDLPSELVQSHVSAELGRTIHGFFDKDDSSILYTEEFINRQKVVIRGALSAATKVVAIKRVVQELGLSSGLFFRCLDELLESNLLRGSLIGGRNVDRAIFIPQVYDQMLKSYARDFYDDNGYIDFSPLKRLGVIDVASFVTATVPKSDRDGLVMLSNCAMSADAWSDAERKVCDSLDAHHWCDTTEVLRPEIAVDAADRLSQANAEWRLVGNTFLYKQSLVDVIRQHFEAPMAKMVEKESPNISKRIKEMQRAQDDELPDAAPRTNRKGGGGKKGKRKGTAGDVDTGNARQQPQPAGQLTFEFLSEQQIVDAVAAEVSFENLSVEVLEEIAEKLRPDLNAIYKERLMSVFLSNQSDASAQQKRTHSEFQAQMKKLHGNICVFDASCSAFDELTAIQLRQLLLKTQCTEAANTALCFLSGTPNASQLSAGKLRDATVNALSSSTAQQAFTALYASLTGKKESLDEFYQALAVVSGGDVCALNLKPPDKRTRNELVEGYAKELARSIEEVTDCSTGETAAALLLSAVLHLLARDCALAVHATGKFVPNLISVYSTKATSECNDSVTPLLLQLQQLVVRNLKKETCDADAGQMLVEKCEQLKMVISLAATGRES